MSQQLRVMSAVLMVVFFISPVFAEESDQADSGAIHVESGRFVDGYGREVILRGVNAGGRSKLPPFYPFEPTPDFDTALARYADGVKSLGFNVVRLLVIWEAAEPTRGEYDESYLALLDKMVRAFAERGIFVIIDSHQDLVSRRFCGDGFPDWAIPAEYRGQPQHADCQRWNVIYFKSPTLTALDRFWNNEDGLTDSYAAWFKMMAKRWRDEPMLIGFEPINEPMPGRSGYAHYSRWRQSGLYRFYEKVGKAVHEADQRFLIFADICAIENTGTIKTSRPRPKIDNLALAPHYYDLGTFGKSIQPGGDQWFMRWGLSRHLKLAKNWDAPMLVGEYGISPLNDNAPAYINLIYEVFDELLLSGTFWEASMSGTIWNHENTSVFAPDGSLRPGAQNLDRPYPRAVAGIIKSFSYDPETGRIELMYIEYDDSEAMTELYLPARIYGETPRVTLTPPGRSSFDAPGLTLSVSPLGAAEIRTLVVEKE